MGAGSSFKVGDEVFFVALDETALEAARQLAIDALDAIVLAWISPDDRDRYSAMRAREVDPVPMSDIAGVVGWLGMVA